MDQESSYFCSYIVTIRLITLLAGQWSGCLKSFVFLDFITRSCWKTACAASVFCEGTSNSYWLSCRYVLLLCLFAAAELFLVLPLCGGEEVFQDTPQVLECGSVLRLFPPAQQHEVVEPVWTVVWLWHPVVSLQLLYDLWVGHPWATHKQKCNTVTHTYVVSDLRINLFGQRKVTYQGKVCVHMSLFLLEGCRRTTHLIL